MADASVIPTTPEPRGDVLAQFRALADPTHPKDAMFLVPVNRDDLPAKLPPGIQQVQRLEGVLLTTNKAKAATFRDKPDLSDADMAGLLGLPQAKADALADAMRSGREPVVMQARDNAGSVVTEAAVGPSAVSKARDVLQDHVPAGGDLVVLSPLRAQLRRQIQRN